MKITVESTDRMVTLEGLPMRIWEGTTDSGIAVICFVATIAVHKDSDQSQFQRELREHKTPSAAALTFPARMVL